MGGWGRAGQKRERKGPREGSADVLRGNKDVLELELPHPYPESGG